MGYTPFDADLKDANKNDDDIRKTWTLDKFF